MANYAIIRIEKRETGSVTNICNHHERLKERYRSNPDIDPERTHLNYHIVQPGGKYRQLVEERIREAGAKKRKDSVVMQDCLITASPEWLQSKSEEEQAEYLNYAYEFMEKKYGRENIISAVVHLDEANPHMHLCFVPITKDGRLSSKEIIGGPKGMVKLQDEFHEYMEKKYPELTRGVSKKITHRKHISTAMYKQANELFKHYEEIVAAVQDIGLIHSAEKKDAAIALLGRYAPEMAQIKKQMESTDKYIKYLEQSVSLDKQSMRYKDGQISELDNENYKLRTELRNLQKKQHKLQKQIDKIPPELMEQLAVNEKKRRKENRER